MFDRNAERRKGQEGIVKSAQGVVITGLGFLWRQAKQCNIRSTQNTAKLFEMSQLVFPLSVSLCLTMFDLNLKPMSCNTKMSKFRYGPTFYQVIN